ncbi:MAG TPA: hypothetical protein VFQ63_02115 [Patescibacteria group bacterium]|nr:hypothetical protein [Patescibacteria group bacterium]
MAKKTKQSSHSHTHLHLLIVTLSVLVVILGFGFISTRSEAEKAKSEAQKQLVRKECNAKGNPVINVTQKILNDADSGEAGNYWAYDTIERRIQVWKGEKGTYCATVKYEGKFAAIAGQRSPGNTGVLTGTEKGEFEGGYRADITGALLSSPSLPTKGSIGTTDYKCDVNGNCPGSFDWTTKYFNTSAAGFTFSMPWWGWTYRNGHHIWVNAITGNSGDII